MAMGGKHGKSVMGGNLVDDGYCKLFPLTDLPNDMLILILSFLPGENVLNCRRVCKLWRDLADSVSLWRMKCEREKQFLPEEVGIPPEDVKIVYFKGPYSRNLVRNPCGFASTGPQEGLENWRILDNGGDGFRVESTDPAVGSKPLVDAGLESKNCFATSYGACVKEQTIDLVEEGVSVKVLDTMKPDIDISEWSAPRNDCGSVYELRVTLLDGNMEPLLVVEHNRRESQWSGGVWQKFSETVSDYPSGLRYIRWWHKGQDSQFWAGYYGPKITGSSLRLVFRPKKTTHH